MATSELLKKNPNKGWINGGFFVLSPKVLDFIESDETMWGACANEKAGKG